jgi:major vault protein
MIIVPPRHYCVIENPVVRDKDGKLVIDASGQAKLAHADLEVRLAQDPFPLWPGEVLQQKVAPLKVIKANFGLHLKAIHDFEDEHEGKRTAGDEWIFEGPGMN